MMNTKISIIGAGSAVFSVSLIKDICLTPNLHSCVISFMDIDQERLDAAYELCSRFAEEAGIDLKLEKTTNRIESLKGADFVINTALAGRHEWLKDGWAIAEKYGYRFGGSYHIMHDEAFWVNFYQLRLMEEILLDIIDICPDALYMVVANPVLAGITYLQRKYPKAKMVGLCHGYSSLFIIAKELGLEKEHITYEIPGVNHFVWLTQFNYKGKNAFPILNEWIKNKSEEYWKTCRKSDYMGPKPVDLYKRFGVFPIGDTCTPGGGTWPYWYHTDHETESKWNENPIAWYDHHYEWSGEYIDQMNKILHDKSLKVTDIFPLTLSGEPMIPIIEAITCDIERVVTVNILNSGNFVPGIPQDFEVETTALVSKRGIQGIKTNGLPKELIPYILRDRIAPVEMELLAFQNGDKKLIKNLIMMDPWTKSEKQATEFMNEIFALPYLGEMRKYYNFNNEIILGGLSYEE